MSTLAYCPVCGCLDIMGDGVPPEIVREWQAFVLEDGCPNECGPMVLDAYEEEA